MNNIYTLRTGDMVQYAGQPSRALRITDCAAVVAVVRPPRQFTTLAGKTVRLQPSPKLERISSNSEIPILNR